MAHPAFVWRAYYRQNRGSFPSAFPAGKLDALAICEEEDGEGRKALITRRATTVPGRALASPALVWERERGALSVPCKATTVGVPWDVGSFPPQGGLGDACLVSLSIPAELGGCWHPGIPLSWPVGPVGALCPAPGWDLSLESAESRGLCPLHLQPGPRWEAACTH